MAKKGSQILGECKTELKSIITELESIENSVRLEFKNVGNSRCADSIGSVVEKYRSAFRTLDSINPASLDD